MEDHNQAMWACAPNTVTYRPETGEKRRHFGQVPGGWAFDPVESVFDLPHYPNFTDSGTLLVSTHSTDTPNTQYIREFELDEETSTLHEIWSHEAYWYAEYAGEATRLENGNTLINAGTSGVIQELSPDGEVVWELGWPQKVVGRTPLIDDLYALNAWSGG